MKILACSGALLILAAPALAQSYVGSFPLPTTNGIPAGLTRNGGGDTLVFTDIGGAGEIGVVTTSGAVQFTQDVSANSGNPLGVATSVGGPGPNRLFVTDTQDDDVDVYDFFLTYLGSFSVANETRFPEGIAYRVPSDTLFVVDGFGTNQVFEYDRNGVLLGASPLNGSSPDGIAWDPDDDTFWVYDSGTDSLRHYDSSFNELSAAPGPAANGLFGGEGVAIIGDRIYVCASGSDAVAVFEKPGRGRVQVYGRGCPAPADFYELFPDGAKDLDGLAITLTPTGSGYDVAAGGAFDANFSNNLFAGDDQLFPSNALAFVINVPGYGPVNTVDIDSNGRCGFGIPGSDFTETVGEFLGGNGAILAANWDDLAPHLGGGVYFDSFADRALITWNQVPQFPNEGSNTFQVQILSTGQIVMAWQQIEGDGLVGFSTGAGIPDPGPIDLSAALPFSAAGGAPLTLEATSRPVIGQPLTTVTTNVPTGATLASLLVFFARVEITAPIFLPSCTIYATGNLDAFPIDPMTGQAGFPMPNDPWLVGQTIYAQSVIADPSIPSLAPVYLSNGLELFIGER